jgi:hypothetical protein
MIRHKPGLLKGKPQVVEQGTNILAVVEHPELAPDQYPDEHSVPTRCLTAHDEWPSLNQLPQAFFLPGGQLRTATTAMTGDQAVQAVEEKGPLPVVETGCTEAPALAQHRDGYLVHQHIDQHGGASHQAHIVLEVGLLQLGVQGFDRRRTELHSDAHGSILLFRYDRNVSGEIHPVAHGHQFCISNSFSEDL